MKTMKNFAAQQLTKNKMNEVKGGVGSYACATRNGKLGIYLFTFEEAVKFLDDNGGGTCNHLDEF